MRDTDVQREIDRMSRRYDDDDIQDYVRPWRGLTKEDLQEFAEAQHGWEDLCRAVEAKLKERNYG